jgi:hypothetical protein
MNRGTPFNAADAINAEPTYAHRALTALHAHGLLAEWIQQNHGTTNPNPNSDPDPIPNSHACILFAA